jgi:hypothetical protein
MNFLKELNLKDQVEVHENTNKSALIFSITKEEKTCFALQLELKP